MNLFSHKSSTKMKKYTESKTFKFSNLHMDAFEKLRDYDVSVDQFVGLVIAEKVNHGLFEIFRMFKRDKEDLPFDKKTCKLK
jgi:hypothetical protein